MVNIQSPTAEIRRGKKKKIEDRKKLQDENIYGQGDHKLEMWANAQRDGRPAEYRWRPLFNTAKFG